MIIIKWKNNLVICLASNDNVTVQTTRKHIPIKSKKSVDDISVKKLDTKHNNLGNNCFLVKIDQEIKDLAYTNLFLIANTKRY